MNPNSDNAVDIARRKNATLNDVAAQAGVSLTTAAGVLRNAPGLRTSVSTRQRVIEASARLGYRRNAVAASLKVGKTHLIGVLLAIRDPASMPHSLRAYSQDLLVAILHAATSAGLRMIPLSLPDIKDEMLLSSLTDRQVDGLIIGSVYDTAFINNIESAGVPCVEVSGSGRYVVTPDNEGGAGLAVEHLASLGHRRIVHWQTGGGVAASQRVAGFTQAATRLGISAAVVQGPDQMKQVLHLPATERPTAVFAFNDYFASLVLDFAQEAGMSVPEELSIVGFDNNIFAETSRPQLTTIHNPLEEQAEAAVDLLLARLRGTEPAKTQIVIPTRLVIRDSTASSRKEITLTQS